MRARRVRPLLAIAALFALALVARSQPPTPPAVAAGPPGLESAPTSRVEGVPYVGANDLARLLSATEFWRADVRKLVLRAGDHRVTLTVGNPFVVVDDRTSWLRAPVLSQRGEVQAPIALLDLLPRDSTIARLVFEPRRGVVVKVPATGLVRSPEVSAGDSLTRIVFPVERVADVTVVGRARGHFRLRFAGAFMGLLPESLPPASLVRGIASLASAGGSAFELGLSPGTAGYRLGRTETAVTLDLLPTWRAGLEDFAPEAGPLHGVRVIVLDPGHGGADAGMVVGKDVEKDLALSLARSLRADLTRRLGAQVVLTREDDRALDPERRAEAANHARADLVISLHFDAVPGTQRAGATAWCPPALLGSREAASSARGPIALLSWREVGERHAVQARAAAEAILGAIELAGAGPARLRERLMVPLLGVDAPSVMLDCATLTAIPDRLRLEDPHGLEALSAAIADGVARWAGGR